MTAFTLDDWPSFGFADDARPALTRALKRGPAVLVSLIALQGGGPRPVGAQMVFSQDEVSGFLSGGCIEGDVALHAAACLNDGEARRLIYGEGSPWPDIRLLCGARLEVLVERVAPGDVAVAALLALSAARQPAVWISDGERRVCTPLEDAAPWRRAFEHRFDPPWRLIVLGGDPTALALASLGVACGYETTLVRTKGPISPPPISGVVYRRDSPQEALAALDADPWTAVAVCHHDIDLDEAALLGALGSRAAYVGLLGGRARLPERMGRLRALGVPSEALARLRAPIGLDLGGKAPFEVAVAVMGEVIARRHAKA